MDNNIEKTEKSEELKKDAEINAGDEKPKAKKSSNKSTDIENTTANDVSDNEDPSVLAEAPTESEESVAVLPEDESEDEEPIPESVKPKTEEHTTGEAPSDEEIDEDFSPVQIALDIPDTTLNELAYDDEPSTRSDDVDNTAGFEDFLMSYRKQVSDMLKAGRTPSHEDEDSPAKEEEDDEDCLPHFSALNYQDEDEDAEDNDEAVQLTIDPSAVPFTPLKESEKKEEYSEKKYSYDPKKPGLINNLFDLFEIFVFTVAIVLFISSFFFRHSEVDGGSMDNTLSDGEHLILYDLFYTPKRGDIVVFEDYSLDKKIPIVKRVIGIEGDTVRVENENGVSVVYLNGERLDESYTLTDDYDSHPSGEWTVGEGELFVLGDHRNVSWDGRSFGTIDSNSVLGKVVLRFYPFNKFGTVN